MRLTRAGEYAVRCVLYLSKKGKGALVSRKEVAEQAVIPSHFLAKIAQELAKVGMIEIRQGAKGGFVLLMDPEEITLLQVVEIVIGEIFLNDCVVRPKSCDASPNCSVHVVWMRARDQLRDTLGSVTFAELIKAPICISE
ncbi:transcriptional regulator, Rrf2 family [delta proteobacterium NaphS2]|nr:transcriptional regulator, Rrf2 family [delta proteobacterium NaphS2]